MNTGGDRRSGIEGNRVGIHHILDEQLRHIAFVAPDPHLQIELGQLPDQILPFIDYDHGTDAARPHVMDGHLHRVVGTDDDRRTHVETGEIDEGEPVMHCCFADTARDPGSQHVADRIHDGIEGKVANEAFVLVEHGHAPHPPVIHQRKAVRDAVGVAHRVHRPGHLLMDRAPKGTGPTDHPLQDVALGEDAYQIFTRYNAGTRSLSRAHQRHRLGNCDVVGYRHVAGQIDARYGRRGHCIGNTHEILS